MEIRMQKMKKTDAKSVIIHNKKCILMKNEDIIGTVLKQYILSVDECLNLSKNGWKLTN